MQQIAYIVTVGTGTAGRTSNLAQGLVNGIRLAAPGCCLLVPSADENSRITAELVAEEFADADGRRPTVRVGTPLSDPDDLERCRREMRVLIRAVRREFPEAEIVLNPTSGTKQMTTGAVLAGLDEGVGRLEYITGERRDGVVRTGSERLTRVDGRRVLARQTARNALALMRFGAYRGAGRILEEYDDLFPLLLALSRVFGFWHRFAYRKALRAVPADEEFARLRRPLSRLAEADDISLERAADMMAFVGRALEFGEPEEALAVLYRLAELLAKLRLSELGVEVSSLDLDIIREKLNPPRKLFEKLRFMKRDAGGLRLGLALTLELLRPSESPLVEALDDSLTWHLLQERQETRYGHGTKFIAADKVRELERRLLQAAAAQWPGFPELVEDFRFPDMQPLTEEELEHV